jgi:hypothetical protein
MQIDLFRPPPAHPLHPLVTCSVDVRSIQDPSIEPAHRNAAMTNLWRLFFVLCGVGILAGGPLHPGGTMAGMLAHPDWFRSHVFILAGLLALVIGLVSYAQRPDLSWNMRRALRLGIAGGVLQSIEMAFHTAAMVDHDNLLAGAPTPILTTHLWLTASLYPIFGATMVAMIVTAAKERMFGGWWIAWLGMAGAVAHGMAGPLVVLFEVEWARVLFPMLVLLAFWCILAACWPARAVSGVRHPVRSSAESSL